MRQLQGKTLYEIMVTIPNNLITQRMEDSSIEKQDVTDSAIAVVQVSAGIGNLLRNITPT